MKTTSLALALGAAALLGLYLLIGCEPPRPLRPSKPPKPPQSAPSGKEAKPAPAEQSAEKPEGKKPATTSAEKTAAKAPGAEKPAGQQRGNCVSSGSKDKIRFAVAWSADVAPSAAGRQAAEAALGALGCPAKAVLFCVYFEEPGFAPEEENRTTACKADAEAELSVAKAVDAACGEVPNIGCRAQSLTNGGTLLKNAVGVLAIGGDRASANTCAVPIEDDRLATGKAVADAMKDVKDLKLVVAMAEMRLDFEIKAGVNADDFIRGVLGGVPKGVALLGGNAMPDYFRGDRRPIAVQSLAELSGAQFRDGEALRGHVVALGIGGPFAAFGSHADEFKPADKTVAVTDARDKWVVTLDGRPAEQVYRQTRGMKPGEPLTSDWQHPVALVVSDGKQYLRMIQNWVGRDGKDREGNPSGMPPGSLAFVAPVAKGAKIRILCGGDSPDAIVAAAKEGVAEAVGQVKAAGDKPVLCLVSDCCTRGMRLRVFGKSTDDEAAHAMLPALGDQVPLFGFYAWGELGPIQGEYQGLSHQYQQHTIVSTVLGVAE
jgi:hypothetical protein